MGTNAEWTYMIYMAGENSLSHAGDDDLKEMREVGSSSDVNILVQFDRGGNVGTNRYYIQKGGIDEKIESLGGKIDSGDPETLKGFIDWSSDNYPANRYALILWDHGSGWEPSEIDKKARELETKNWSFREVVSLSNKLYKTFFSTTIDKIFDLDTPRLRAIFIDEGSGHSIDTIELGKVLAHAKEKIGKPLDILGMDACLMSNLEVAYQAENHT